MTTTRTLLFLFPLSAPRAMTTVYERQAVRDALTAYVNSSVADACPTFDPEIDDERDMATLETRRDRAMTRHSAADGAADRVRALLDELVEPHRAASRRCHARVIAARTARDRDA